MVGIKLVDLDGNKLNMSEFNLNRDFRCRPLVGESLLRSGDEYHKYQVESATWIDDSILEYRLVRVRRVCIDILEKELYYKGYCLCRTDGSVTAVVAIKYTDLHTPGQVVLGSISNTIELDYSEIAETFGITLSTDI